MKYHFIHLIADYGIGDPSFSEVIQRLKGLDNNIEVLPLSVPPFSTLATGFWIAQLALHNPFPGMAVYSNTAPRKDMYAKRKENEGEKLTFALLDNGVPVIAVNAGYCFSFVRENIKQINYINVQNRGSQFRSRDFFPKAVMGILNGDKSFIGEKIALNKIPDIPKNRIAFVDGYGNLKTTCKYKDLSKSLKTGERIKIKINHDIRMAIFSDGSFAANEGDLVFAPGSSGPKENRFMEIFLRGDSAFQLFDNPQVGSEFSFGEKDSFLWR
jgi:S-adenosylmethionine hydrolase